MLKKRFVCLILAAFCILGLAVPAMASADAVDGPALAEEPLERGAVDCDAVYCFTATDFSREDQPLAGICITGLPDSSAGTVLLGSRVLRSGDILTAGQVEQMTFSPLRTQENAEATMTFLPIYDDHVAASSTMTISIRGKEDKAPMAEDMAVETYKNLPKEGKLKVSDPEGGEMTFTVVRQPKRGEVILRPDGTFLYTPKKNKVGIDSFVFTATDPAGNVSRQATVTVELLKPTDDKKYTDTVGKNCRFEAEWMRNSGLFVGESINNESCFQPEKPVSRGEFVAMVVDLLEIPMDSGGSDAVGANVPDWLRPYLNAALRSGLLEGAQADESWNSQAQITGGEAAVMLQNVLDLKVTAASMLQEGEEAPDLIRLALQALSENGISLAQDQSLTRGDVACLLYQVDALAETAPGTQILPSRKN